jgi:hypothetical protein
MIASRIARLSIVLIISLWLWQTLLVVGACTESTLDQSVTSSNRWWYSDGVLAKSNLSHPPLMSFTVSGGPASCAGC